MKNCCSNTTYHREEEKNYPTSKGFMYINIISNMVEVLKYCSTVLSEITNKIYQFIGIILTLMNLQK